MQCPKGTLYPSAVLSDLLLFGVGYLEDEAEEAEEEEKVEENALLRKLVSLTVLY